MATLSEWINRLRYLGGRSRFEDDLEAEVRFHIETRAAELQASGLSRSDAIAKAHAEFGSIARAAEDSRAAWQFRWIEDLAGDLRYGLRSFRRSPGFALTAILSLALGIGANAAIFNAIYTVLWKPLPVSKPEELVALLIRSANTGIRDAAPVAFIRQLRSAGVFESVSVTSADGLSFSYDDRAERIVAEVVSPSYFDLLGVRPFLGQAFTPAVRSGQWAAEAVLSYNFWQRRFGGDPSVIGHTIRLNTHPFTIAGVSPPGFFGLGRGTDFEIRIPILPDGRELAQIAQIGARPDRGLLAIARLKSDSNLAQAESFADAQLQEFLRTTTIQRFRARGIQHIKLVSLGKGDGSALQTLYTPLYILFVLVALVLLIACANIANMLLARAAARARELAVRTSIGAGRFRLIRQLLAESLLLSLLAGALAVVIGNWVAVALVRFLPQGHIATVLDLRVNGITVIFILALSLAACVTFGLAPAVHTTRGNLAAMLKSDTGASIGDFSSGGFRRSLVVAQVAFSLVLLIAAGIFVRTMFNLRPTDYGEHPEHVLLFTMKPQQEIYTPIQRRALLAELVRRVSAVPGVQSAAVAEYGPLGSRSSSGVVVTSGRSPIKADVDWVTTGFFETIGFPLVAGTDFAETNRQNGSPSAIINQSLARSLFPNDNPIGRSIRLSVGRIDSRQFEIIGVVADAHYYDIHVPPEPMAWFPFQDYAPPYMPTLHVRTSRTDAAATIGAVRREFDSIDKGFPVFNVKSLEVRIEESLSLERILANLSGAVGFLALTLAAVGLYGILAYSVSRRTREVGIRMALGSSARSVLWIVAREALLLIAVGSLAGVALSLACWRLLSHQLPGVSSIDASVLMVCAAIMLALAAAAITVPAIRACRIDPLMALRHE